MKLAYETKIIKGSNYSVQLFVDYINERLRVDDYRGSIPSIIQELDRKMDSYKFTKLIFFSKSAHWQPLLSNGFALEGMISGFFNGSNCYIMTRYKNIERRTSKEWVNEDNILQAVFDEVRKKDEMKLPERYICRKADINDANELAQLYGKVFSIYPTPMNNPEYVMKMISGGTIFYVVEHDKQLVSAASADVNQTFHHAEITDCATLPEHRKYGLMKILIKQLENELMDQGIYCAFSIARALSFGMNAALFQLGYHYTGRLTNNCYIFDKLEDMNVWVKDLSC